jgi:hypothetical protein
MADEKDGPQNIPTKQLPRVDVSEDTLNSVLSEVRAARADIHLVSNDVTIVKDRVRLVEMRLDDHDSRAKRNSERAQGTSKVDMAQDSAIATLLADVSSLKETQATQLAILTKLDAVAANPMVRRVAYAIGAAILAYLASKGWITR